MTRNPDGPRRGDDRPSRNSPIALGVFVAVLSFVTGMTFLGSSPWEALGLAIAAGTASGTILSGLFGHSGGGGGRTDRESVGGHTPSPGLPETTEKTAEPNGADGNRVTPAAAVTGNVNPTPQPHEVDDTSTAAEEAS